MVFLTVTVDSYSPWGQVRVLSTRGNLSGAVWWLRQTLSTADEIHQEPVTLLNHVLCNPISLKYQMQMGRWVGTQKFCSCQFVEDLHPLAALWILSRMPQELPMKKLVGKKMASVHSARAVTHTSNTICYCLSASLLRQGSVDELWRVLCLVMISLWC